MRESDPLDWEKAGSDSTQSEGLGTGTGTALKNTVPQNNKVIIILSLSNSLKRKCRFLHFLVNQFFGSKLLQMYYDLV